MELPYIIQGGMGAGVSGWPLARAVSERGQLGVVAGTALASIFVRRLQLGDVGGHLRRALGAFPHAEMAKRVLEKYYKPNGKRSEESFKLSPMPGIRFPKSLLELTAVASFAEVFLAKEKQPGLVGLNLLEKIQVPNLATLFGAMVAGVDYVLMGAGIPRTIPGILDRLAKQDPVELRIDVEGALPGEIFSTTFNPTELLGKILPPLKRPNFLAIISSSALATTLARKSSGRVDGFVVEGPSAGGHNAPPRGQMQLTPDGEPLYGPRDVPEIDKIRALGLPFWLAGSYGRPGKLQEALDLGAAGIQVGTAFAFCEESGIRPDLKTRAIELSRQEKTNVFTDPLASPTGFPLKVLQMENTVSEPEHFLARRKLCDLGYLRRAYRQPDGSVGYRCPAEPVEDYVRKGGALEDTKGRKCVCNGLLATVGLSQTQANGYEELPLITAGDDASDIAQFLRPGHDTYTADDVLDCLVATPHTKTSSKFPT